MNKQSNNKDDINTLKSEVEYRTKLQDICNKIYAALNLDEIIINLKDEITSLFIVERLTIYYVDGVKKELVSRFKTGSEVGEIRVPIAKKSIAGYSAFTKNLVNIEDVYDEMELRRIDPSLHFDGSWDKKTGYRTKQVLAYPIIYKKMLLGLIQLINRKDNTRFNKNDEEYVTELAKIMGIALYNQKRMAAKARPTKFGHLISTHIISQKELNKAIGDARNRKVTIEQILLDEFSVEKKDIGDSLSKYYGTDFQEYDANYPIPGDLLAGLKIPFMMNNIWVPLYSGDDYVYIAIDDPNDLQRINEIKTLFINKTVKAVVALKEDIHEFIKLFTQDENEIASMDEIMAQLQGEDEEIEEAESAVSEESSAVVQLVNKVILDAYSRNASDIHIEPFPGKENTRVRIRIDGSCTMYQTIPYHFKNAVVSRIKIMADLDISERRKPQDGKIKFKKYGGKDIELRVATVPTQGGLEDIVMRLLASGEPIPLKNMNFSEYNYKNMIDCITQPYGIIFVCGPTGSGKTTTLHSALSYINKIETKIWTAEDPVEITQSGLRQVQVKPKIGFDFAEAMRSFLRADPDVIMVGEMRDKETTSIGIEASLTGHLVLSTLHTNSAPESITRLLDMGMDPFNFADAILCILAQRLLRTLCKKCKEEYHPEKAEFNDLAREYGEDDFFNNTGIKYTKNLMLFKPNGCSKCNNTGYAGRTAIHELLIGTDEMKKKIQSKERMEVLRTQALKDGMTTLKQDGIEKIFSGNCDLLQVRKVCIK